MGYQWISYFSSNRRTRWRSIWSCQFQWLPGYPSFFEWTWPYLRLFQAIPMAIDQLHGPSCRGDIILDLDAGCGVEPRVPSVTVDPKLQREADMTKYDEIWWNMWFLEIPWYFCCRYFSQGPSFLVPITLAPCTGGDDDILAETVHV
jgi:hypothetical protein